jgi:hypothetical protein
MHLAGRANWWLPGWLDRGLPHLSIEPSAQHTDSGEPAVQLARNELAGSDTKDSLRPSETALTGPVRRSPSRADPTAHPAVD